MIIVVMLPPRVYSLVLHWIAWKMRKSNSIEVFKVSFVDQGRNINVLTYKALTLELTEEGWKYAIVFQLN